jgi:hypothetical protein
MADRSVSAAEGPSYPLNIRCAVSGCVEQSAERHHLWRRSFLGGDYWWVQLPDGRRVGNCINLCNTHHRKVTENRAFITLLDEEFFWAPEEGDLDKLTWQPPTLDGQDGHLHLVEVEPTYMHADDVRTLYKPVESKSDECPTCHQKIRAKIETPIEAPRPRRTWSMAVPKDDQEDGADTIDRLIIEAREELDKVGLSYGDGNKYIFNVVATALALFVLHAPRILADG